MEALFWILLFLLFYAYFGYGLLLLLLNAIFRRRRRQAEAPLPPLTFIVPAYNEEDIILQKIKNTLALDYPPGCLSLLFVTDGSTDATPALVAAYTQIRLLHAPERQGKAAALNRAMDAVQTPITVFSDANTLVHPQSLRRLVRHYADEGVGGVSGEKRIAARGASAAAFGERLYWRYESLLKKAASDFYTLVGAAGELFSIRTSLFQPLPCDTLLDDFALSAAVCLRGCRFAYEAGAFGYETASASLAEERKRKVRISAGCYQALVRMPALLNPLKNPRLAFQYFSHRVLRWTVCPVALPLLLAVNFVLALQAQGKVYLLFFLLQALFYTLALGGLLWLRRLPKPLLLPAYFVFMVLSQYSGFFRFLQGRQPVLWEKAARGKE